MTDSSSMVVDAAERIFKDLADPQSIIQSGSNDWRAPLWDELDAMGLPLAWVPESLGGFGLGMAEGLAVARAAGRAALAVPLVETLLAGWIAGKAGLALPQGTATVIIAGAKASAELDDTGLLRAQARGVPFASEVQSIVILAADAPGIKVAIVSREQCRIDTGQNLAGDALNNVQIDTQAQTRGKAPGLSLERALYVAATCRSLQIAGALQAILDLSVGYAKERVAFGKPIGKFQAVQQNLARLGGEVAAAVAVAESAADTLDHADVPATHTLLEVASAKIRCGEAAQTGAAIAHQVLGAIGYTEEHILHRFTLRMLSWRDDYGSEAVWAKRLGEMVRPGSGADLWQLLTAR